MGGYTLIDAAIDGVKNYTKALEIRPEEVDISLNPYFNDEGETIRMSYELNLHGKDLDLSHRETYDGLEEVEDQMYPSWVERFVEELPEANIHFRSVSKTESEIEDAIQNIRTFTDMARTAQISVIADPAYDPETDSWSIEYYTEADGRNGTNMHLDMSHSFEEESYERFKNEIYPLWISNFKDEFPDAEIFYPAPEDLDNLLE